MRIAHFAWESLYSIKVGGVAYVVSQLAEAQAKLGHEVHVFTRIGPNQKVYEVINGVHYHRCPYSYETDFFKEMAHNLSNSIAYYFKEAEKKFGPFDIVHGHDWHIVNAMDIVKKELNKKLVFTFHSTEYGRNGNHIGDGGVSEGIRGLEWYGSYIANMVTTISNVMRDEVKWLYKIPDWKLRIIYNAIDYGRFDDFGFVDAWQDAKRHLGFGVWDPVILFIGRFMWQKGPDMLVEAIPHVVREFPNARFVFLGDGPMRMGCEDRAKQLSVWGKNAFFLGYVSEEDKIKWLKACDMLVVPSRNEPFGLVVLEGWANYKPVIAPHSTGAGEIIWHEVTGLKVYQEPESIAWGVKELLRSPDKAKWMGQNGRVAVEKKFNWDNIAREYVAVYEEVLRG
ncbi:MAG: glycosyltransferase family 4 protein [Candidatus Aenigmarchaeota archaeon]|nr:glycosyltransferase family 4 protein [Candidatus Aenigmarchaeota archaeon]